MLKDDFRLCNGPENKVKHIKLTKVTITYLFTMTFNYIFLCFWAKFWPNHLISLFPHMLKTYGRSKRPNEVKIKKYTLRPLLASVSILSNNIIYKFIRLTCL